jgi:hypothetical protein
MEWKHENSTIHFSTACWQLLWLHNCLTRILAALQTGIPRQTDFAKTGAGFESWTNCEDCMDGGVSRRGPDNVWDGNSPFARWRQDDYMRLTESRNPKVQYFDWVVPNAPTNTAVLNIRFGCLNIYPETPSLQLQSAFVISPTVSNWFLFSSAAC